LRKHYNKILLFLIFLLISPSVFANDIISYKETIDINKEGNAEVTIKVEKIILYTKGILIPLKNNSTSDVKVFPDNIIEWKYITTNGNKYIFIQPIKDSCSLSEIKVTYNSEKFIDFERVKLLDFGDRILEYQFQNLSGENILFFQCDIILPEDFIVNKVMETLPVQKDTTTFEQVVLKKVQNKNGLELRAKKLKLYETTSVKFNYKVGGKSIYFLTAIFLIAVLYLIFFRNVLKPQKNDFPKQ
jgi:hypothetical protein